MMFGISALLDHPFMEFDQGGGKKLLLPCGTIPTALVEYASVQEDGTSLYATTIYMATPAQGFEFVVRHSVEEVQAIFRAGVRALNREELDRGADEEGEGPLAVLSFPRDLDDPEPA